MIKRTLKQVEKMINGTGLVERYAEITVQGVSIDTRKIEKGNLYVPIQGDRFDGHSFVDKAVENGAVATLWKKDVQNPPTDIPVIFVEDTLEALQALAKSYRDQLDVKVIGVTGSNGKTSTKDIVTSLLATKFKVQKTEGNFNNHIGLPLTILSLEENTEMAVLEMGMSSLGEIEFLSKLARPNAAIITNIGEAHLMDLGSRDAIAEAKLEIVTGLQNGGVFVYNGDEPLLTNRVPNMNLAAETITFGDARANDYYPTSVTLQATGTYFKMNQDKDTVFYLPVLGKHNVYNTLASMAIAKYFGVTWEEMKQGLVTLQMTGMRMEIVKTNNGLTVINDAYNASPTAMEAAFHLMNGLDGFAKKVVVLGDMLELGDQEVQFHYEVGKLIDPAKISYVFTYGRLGAQIAEGAKINFPKERVKVYDNKEELVKELQTVIDEKDVVLVKASRGMKLEEIITMLK
ncbi:MULTISPECIES: UDP-N-acetylmuramoyl-tripeptide--D-alanyl-D-alanine ligase [Bacillus cereus group]|uniref:UDP-N-acetylmuramoyl-tripeptide--D-alanyl-D-alanine ligase n=2 Tax=Bacillus cereus TaxID=1396 RepID=A0A2B1YLE5_BACCE|nr:MULTISPECIES: UDP-N-acetylmuramoyl-tripeptide--D-alanyl-D-alanine ligase [Bacillus cereus group]PFA21834.1 UDP-N-acetylmuramoyl-tripeptide--D-alanyl-D-alanine ligase [Bacillus cereus]PFK32495.1 UDP-N-acetylmuramoyl-tripeptide--D-alanyl-D-alanine ligase [Bacillus cereus]PFN06904.1 UDP-N-acetylmuramoyl-tripeptide--D-alanyl-D-alanine ligase [Bacillus cereus]PFO83740.1 UDP-N-acetylmuramoyl-tripeptide--D-alanyl-D-alanine ligase [Bacillus cereus]PFR31862.1 UDP-N-acetylmuramoyl-tripeptide--D-alany